MKSTTYTKNIIIKFNCIELYTYGNDDPDLFQQTKHFYVALSAPQIKIMIVCGNPKIFSKRCSSYDF